MTKEAKKQIKQKRQELISEARIYEVNNDVVSADVCYYKIAGADNRLRQGYIDFRILLGICVLTVIVLCFIIL